MSLQTVALDVPPQDVITRDNVSVKVNAVIFFRVLDATKAVISVEDYLLPAPAGPIRAPPPRLQRRGAA